MNHNVAFNYEASALFELINAEISRHAGFIRLEGGVSAYDILKVHTNDIPTITDYIMDALRGIATSLHNESNYGKSVSNDKVTDFSLSFYLPDFPARFLELATDEIKRFVVLSATSRWLARRSFAEFAQQIASDAQGMHNRVINILLTRDYPSEDV